MKSANRTVAVLDIGSSKVVCLLAAPASDGRLEIRGCGVRRNEGMACGAVVAPVQVEEAVRGAVSAAEQAAEIKIDEVLVSLAAGAPESHMASVMIPLEGQPVSERDVRVAMQAILRDAGDKATAALHAFPACFEINGAPAIRPPFGVRAPDMTVYGHIITAAPLARENLDMVIAAAHLRPAGYVAAPLASGLGCLVEEERETGTACLDLGAGTSSLALFSGGTLAHCEITEGIGEALVTEVASRFMTSRAEARRLIALRGAALYDPADDGDPITVHLLDTPVERGRSVSHPRSLLTRLIEWQMRAHFDTLRTRLSAAGFTARAGGHIVLTGGVAQLPRIADLARESLGCPVRTGDPYRLPGLPIAARNPAFSTAVGLLDYAQAPDRYSADLRQDFRPWALPAAPFERLMRLLRQEF